ncbi:ER membrane protein complex subunit 10 isoform X1 [Capsicum chacoense]
MRTKSIIEAVFFLLLILTTSLGFQSDELLVDDEEFGLEGGGIRFQSRSDPNNVNAATPSSVQSTRKRSVPDSDSKIQFPLEHAFGDSDFSPAGTFTARLKSSSHGSQMQTLTKLRFSRNAFTETEKDGFKKLLKGDDFYRIRVPSNVLNLSGREYVVSSVKARCLPRDGLEEHFVIHMDGVNILAINYGSPGACQYPRQLKFPAKWSFNSHTVLKPTEQAPRQVITPIFSEAVVEENAEGEEVQPPERSFWAKYWMYLIPLGLIVMNAMTQAMNMAEEQTSGQAGVQGQQAIGAQRAQSTVVRRR